MFEGRLLAIGTTSAAGAPLQSADSATLVPGQGIVGDRYAYRAGAFQKPGAATEPSQEVTLIEQEALQAAAAGYELELSHLESRRNLLTDAVPLNHLVGQRFRIGETVLEGLELCEPCKYLQRHTGKEVIKALVHRGGLRARIIEGGTIRVGDKIADC